MSKYKAIIETDEFEDFKFFEDGNGLYIHGIDAGSVDGEWVVLYFTECEQESILDKIRAEIKEVQTYKMFEGEDTVYVKRDNVLAIIDKYKAEGSGEDADSD